MGSRINYVELPVRDLPAVRSFYAQAFGWEFTEFGPEYAATTTGDVDLGIDSDPAEQVADILPVIEVSDLAAAERAVIAAGGRISRPTFAFPGGERFHFRDPHGHELAVACTTSHA